MFIDILPTAQSAVKYDTIGKTIIIIDVLRATSVISTALHNGAQNVITTDKIEKALEYKGEKDFQNIILGGERNALKINGFDLDNSPLNYTRENVKGKTIILTTTNGTLAINNCRNANNIYLASFLNANQTIKLLAKEKNDITIVCAGTEGHFSLEDGLCAGYLTRKIQNITNAEISDFALAFSSINTTNIDTIRALAANSKHYKNLISKGFAADIDFCFNFSNYSAVKLFSSGFQNVPNF